MAGSVKAADCSGFSAESIDSLPEEGVDLFTPGKCGYCEKAQSAGLEMKSPATGRRRNRLRKSRQDSLATRLLRRRLLGELKVDWTLQGNIKFKKV